MERQLQLAVISAVLADDMESVIMYRVFDPSHPPCTADDLQEIIIYKIVGGDFWDAVELYRSPILNDVEITVDKDKLEHITDDFEILQNKYGSVENAFANALINHITIIES